MIFLISVIVCVPMSMCVYVCFCVCSICIYVCRCTYEGQKRTLVSCPICHLLLYSIDGKSLPKPGARLAGGKLDPLSTEIKGDHV